jgi:glycosyltransferase involved in cell wall biosynthesis
MATGRQLTSVARGLAARGHEVTVIAGRRGYDDGTLRFPSRERWHGIDIVRLPAVSLGKTSRWRRMLNFASFSAACVARLAITRRHDVIVALTSPPLISWLASLFTRLKGGRMVFWVMDLNPDEAIAAGWLRPNSFAARVFVGLLESSLRHAAKIVVLDRFVKERIAAKGIPEDKIEVVPPACDDSVEYDREGREAFRGHHNLTGKFVVMYAGNFSPCHPLDTLLEAADKLRAREDVAFCFVGGGSERGKVIEFARTRQLENILCLGYQPETELPGMLSAADLHVVVLGDGFRGIVHPSKIYNILAVRAPFLYIGPVESHLADIISGLSERDIASSARHGEVDCVVEFIIKRAKAFQTDRHEAARPGPAAASGSVTAMAQMIGLIESMDAKKSPLTRIKTREAGVSIKPGVERSGTPG